MNQQIHRMALELSRWKKKQRAKRDKKSSKNHKHNSVKGLFFSTYWCVCCARQMIQTNFYSGYSRRREGEWGENLEWMNTSEITRNVLK